MPQYAPVRPGRHVRAGEFRTIPICPSLRGWPAPGTAAISGFPPTARDVAGSRLRPAWIFRRAWWPGSGFAGRAGQARTADSNGDSNGGNRRPASAFDSSAGRSHISPRLGICHARKADRRRPSGCSFPRGSAPQALWLPPRGLRPRTPVPRGSAPRPILPMHFVHRPSQTRLGTPRPRFPGARPGPAPARRCLSRPLAFPLLPLQSSFDAKPAPARMTHDHLIGQQVHSVKATSPTSCGSIQ